LRCAPPGRHRASPRAAPRRVIAFAPPLSEPARAPRPARPGRGRTPRTWSAWTAARRSARWTTRGSLSPTRSIGPRSCRLPSARPCSVPAPTGWPDSSRTLRRRACARRCSPVSTGSGS
jgi:hypothetical protein